MASRISPGWGSDFALGSAHIFLGKYEEAIPYFKNALIGKHSFYRIHLELAMCYAALGREEEAKAAVQEVLKINPAFSAKKYEKTLPVNDLDIIKPYVQALRKAPFPG
jgi:adenylate cyclase